MKSLKLFLILLILQSSNSFCQEKQLIGVWTMFFVDEEVSSLDCKICPTWVFKENHELIFTKPNDQQDLATWEIDENNLLSFKTADEKEKKMEGLKVRMTFTRKNGFNELRLNEKNKTRKTFVLRKK